MKSPEQYTVEKSSIEVQFYTYGQSQFVECETDHDVERVVRELESTGIRGITIKQSTPERDR